MKLNKLRSILGVMIVLLHVAVILLAFILVPRVTDFKTCLTVIAIIIPVLAIHVTTVVKYFTENAHVISTGRRVNAVFAFFCLLFPILVGCAMSGLILAYYYGWPKSIEDLQLALASVETAFGVYLGVLTSRLYPLSQEN